MDLLVVAKAPVPGRVKTRLCPPLSLVEAAALAEAALAVTLDAAVASGADRVLVALDGRPGPWCPPGVTVVDQGSGPFDRRLAAAWSAVGPGPALQVGMDTPQVGATGLAAALATLAADGIDAVLGPAADGGWWALGLRRPDPSVVLGIPTSRVDTGRRQRARLVARGLRVADLPVARDLDTWDDIMALASAGA
ncbi:MAG: DUF2064 domain-containing protein [Chloroflexi bacterium]|nr:DUF2064 domain-containing protein [Chloroflexota bacterium]